MRNLFPHYDEVNGWLNKEALLFTSFYASAFLENKHFDSLEIGVHHGKFFIGLENLTPGDGRAIAIDVFDDQEKNIDDSGKGDLQIFLGHVDKYCVAPKRVVIMATDSLDVDCSELGKRKFGLLSIDGGHTENHTIVDLTTCNELINSDGLLVLDDILNQDWTGVVSGAVKYFSGQTGRRITPIAVGFNKLFCCHFSCKDLVIKRILQEKKLLLDLGIKVSKRTEFAGHHILSLRKA